MSFPFTVPLTDTAIRETGTVKKFPLGTRGATMDGRIFRYSVAGATDLGIGLLVQSATAHALGTSTDTRLQRAVTSTHDEVHISTTMVASGTVNVDYFNDGYIIVTSTEGTGGQLVYVEDTTASSSGTSGGTTGCVLKLKDGSRVSVSLTTSASTVAPFKNPYDGLIIAVAERPTNAVLGVPIVAVTAAYYFWLQTWGPCCVRQETQVIPVGAYAVPSTGTTGGAIASSTYTTYQKTEGYGSPIGQLLGAAQATLEYVLIELRCEP